MQNQHHSITINGIPIHDKEIEFASISLKAASHPLRLKIMCLLESTEMTVQEILEHVGTTQSNVSQHLGLMRDKGLLSSHRVANRVYYRLAESRIALLHACSCL